MNNSPAANIAVPGSLGVGDLRRVAPRDAGCGGGRGKPIDRHYIEGFIQQHDSAPQSVPRTLAGAFGADSVQVQGYGNVLAATGFLQGLVCEDLSTHEFDHHDDRYPMLVAARARNAASLAAVP